MIPVEGLNTAGPIVGGDRDLNEDVRQFSYDPYFTNSKEG